MPSSSTAPYRQYLATTGLWVVCVGAWAYIQYLGWPLWGWLIGLLPIAAGLYQASKGRRFGHILLLVTVGAYVVSALFLIYPPGEKTRLGLDLRGGLEVVFEAETTEGTAPTSEELDKTLAIVERRVNGLGVSEATVQKQGTDQISVALPGIEDPDQALAVVGKTAQLEFYDDAETQVAGPTESREALLEEAEGRIPDDDLAGLKAGEEVDDYRVVEAPPGVLGGNPSTLYFLYLHEPAMTGAAIQEARQSLDQFDRPNVIMEFTDEGAQQFEEVTKQLAIRGALRQQSQTFAIVLDNVMESDPQVDYVDNPQGISGDSAEITGDFTIQEAQDLALVLNTGALPVTLTPIEKQQVSATLGEDSLNAGLLAGGIGLGLVLIFMVIIYRFLGLVADIALIVYAIILWGVFNAVPVTLTLPGIAGMILTIGVAADANVVVFERIKEEVRRGKSVRSAVNSGYNRGFRTILDANILILLTALILFYFATAQPKGFALTLIIGVVVSMFTAVLATRALLGLLGELSLLNRAAFMGAKAGEMLVPGELEGQPPADEAEGARRSGGRSGRRDEEARAARRRKRRERKARKAAAPAAAVAVAGDGGRTEGGSGEGGEPPAAESAPDAPAAPGPSAGAGEGAAADEAAAGDDATAGEEGSSATPRPRRRSKSSRTQRRRKRRR